MITVLISTAVLKLLITSVANCRFVFSAGGQSSQRREESRSPGQGEDARGGGARVHDQEIPWCLWAAGEHQPGAAEEGEVIWHGDGIDLTFCLSTFSIMAAKDDIVVLYMQTPSLILLHDLEALLLLPFHPVDLAVTLILRGFDLWCIFSIFWRRQRLWNYVKMHRAL